MPSSSPSPRLRRAVLLLVILFPAIQVIPYGHDHRNPPPQQEPSWSSPRTRELARSACFDCHSNETRWPWYADIAPVSWLVTSDVQRGRRHVNFSNWHDGRRPGEKPRNLRKVISEGDMPPLPYRLMHPGARLTASQKQALVNGLVTTAEKSNGQLRPPN